MIVAALAMLASLQITAEQRATLDAGLEDVKAIDAELEAITENQQVLRSSRAARLDEIVSLRSRYPEIVIADTGTVEQVYRALYSVRMSRAAKVKPIAEAALRHSDKELCKASRQLQETRAEVEASDGYKSMTLKERLEWRETFDALNVGKDCKDAPE